MTPERPGGAGATPKEERDGTSGCAPGGSPGIAPDRAPGQAAGERQGRLGAALAPLGARRFRLLVAGQTISTVGDYLYEVGLPFLLLSHGGSAAELGLFLGTYGIARALATLGAGSIADRFGHRRTMLAADSLRTVVVALLGLAALGGRPSLPVLLGLAVPLGVGAGLFLPASFSIIPDLVTGDQLQAANALQSSTAMGASLLGPLLGGVVVAAFGSSAALVGDALTFAVSAASLAAIGGGIRATAAQTLAGTRTAPPSDELADPEMVAGAGVAADPVTAAKPGVPEGRNMAAAAAMGGERGGTARVEVPAGQAGADGSVSDPAAPATFWAFLRSSPLAQGVLTAAFVANLCFGGILDVALPVLVRGPFHGGSAGYGAVLAGFGAGGLAGSLGSTLLAKGERRVRLALLLFATTGVAAAAVPFAGGLRGAVAMAAVMGLSNSIANVLFLTVLQRRVPGAMLGRFMSAIVFANFGLYPISAALAGLAVHRIGPALLFPVAGGVLLLGVGLGALRREVREA